MIFLEPANFSSLFWAKFQHLFSSQMMRTCLHHIFTLSYLCFSFDLLIFSFCLFQKRNAALFFCFLDYSHFLTITFQNYPPLKHSNMERTPWRWWFSHAKYRLGIPYIDRWLQPCARWVAHCFKNEIYAKAERIRLYTLSFIVPHWGNLGITV